MFKIGVMVNSFRLPFRESLEKAKALGADGVQIHAVDGETAPENLDAHARALLRSHLANMGMEVSALCGDLGGHGFVRPSENPQKIERSKKIVKLAADLGTRAVTTHIGVVPETADDPGYQVMRAAMAELAAYAADHGVTFAIETGPEKAATLKRFLDDIDSPGLGVNLDPANLVMVVRDDPVAAARTLGGRIVHTHAKDGVNLIPCDARQVYGAFAEGNMEELVRETDGELFREVPLGEGGVPWPEYLRALADIGYRGYLTVEREVGPDPEGDIGRAVTFLRDQLKAMKP